MSIAEFSDIIKSQAYRNWFGRVQDSILKQTVSELRDEEQKSHKTSFYITENTVKELFKKLTTTEASEETVKSILNNMRNYLKNRAIQIKEPYVEGNALYFPRVNFDTINNILKAGFKDIETDKKISDYYEKGHVFGLATKTLGQTIEKLKASTSLTQTQKDLLVSVLRELYSTLEKEDILTSNYGESGISYTLYAKYRKSKSKYLVELQLREKNQESGKAVRPFINALRRYFDPQKIPFSEKLGIKFREQDRFFKELIESKGSPSFKELIIGSIVDSYEGKKPVNKEYYVAPTKVLEQTVKVSTQKVNTKIKEQKQKIKSLINTIQSKSARQQTTKIKEEIINLISLQNLINANLHDQIQRNMGKGERTDVLNYRTGRFAKSAEVTRMTMSREGAITAFYTYMKNPYATFSEGGKQSRPRSRDPKLLISKSIREIAAQKVANRMRAVVV